MFTKILPLLSADYTLLVFFVGFVLCFYVCIGLFTSDTALYRRHLARSVDVPIQFNNSNLFAGLVVYSPFSLGGCFMLYPSP